MRRMDGQLFQHVCDVLDQAGFRMRDGGRGLIVAATPQGIRVGWRPGYGLGIQAAMAVALASVLERAGYRVSAQDADLLITVSGHVRGPGGLDRDARLS